MALHTIVFEIGESTQVAGKLFELVRLKGTGTEYSLPTTDSKIVSPLCRSGNCCP